MKLYKIKKSKIDKKGRGLYASKNMNYNQLNSMSASTCLCVLFCKACKS